MINLVCGDPITKIWKANVLFKYDYKLWKIENMVVPVGTTGVNGLSRFTSFLAINKFWPTVQKNGFWI